MSLSLHRLRRALPLTSTVLHYITAAPSLRPLISEIPNLQTSTPSPFRSFTSTTTTFLSSRFQSYNNNNNDEIGPDTILFEGCDYNHFLIVVDFPKDPKPSSQEMVNFYEETASKIFGSLEEAKKKIYACSTTTYTGFQVECSEETSEKFKDLPGVIFVLPDSYIDPVNKEYGGDKYINGQIIPRPPPIQYGRSNNREFRSRPSRRGPMEGENRNYGPPVTPQQNFNSPPPPHRSMGENRNYNPPASPQQNFSSPPPPLRNMDGEYRNYGPPVTSHQNFGPSPPQQNYGPPHPQQQYGPPSNFPQHQNYGPPPPQNFGPPPPQSFGQPGLGERRGPLPPNNAPGGLANFQGARRDHMPSNQMQYSREERGNFYPQGQSNFREGNPGSYGADNRSLGGYDGQASPTAQGQETGPGYTQYNQSR